MTYWLGVASAEHVRRGVSLGIAQIGHGKRGNLAKMQPGDGLAYYSPRESLADSKPTLQAFTVIGYVPDDTIWQADEGDFQPWRRGLTYTQGASPAALSVIRDHLELTAQPNWGYSLRRGLIELSEHDFRVIEATMTDTTGT
ncbi:MAG: EVE domain-containing protein [Chloroflexota bacterium]|nr:EVE domain-containing protein [Chloroflexota bacterium]